MTQVSNNPQKENGYTAIANELLEALMRTRISGEARQILDVIIRKTYGFNKKSDRISLRQFVMCTGILKPNVLRGISKLIEMNIIVIKKDNGNDITYSLNKFYETWKPLSKRITLSKKITNVIKKDNESLSKKITPIYTKDNTKDNTKDMCTPIIPGNFILENVRITKKEKDRIINDYGSFVFNEYAERLNDYIEQIGIRKAEKKYNSHAATIRNWIRRDGIKKKNTEAGRVFDEMPRRRFEQRDHGIEIEIKKITGAL